MVSDYKVESNLGFSNSEDGKKSVKLLLLFIQSNFHTEDFRNSYFVVDSSHKTRKKPKSHQPSS